MKKTCLSLLLLFLIAGETFSQSRAVEGMAEFQGKKIPAAVIELPYSPDQAEAGIADVLSNKGHKASKTKDYQLFRSVNLGLGKQAYDIYVKAERKSRKEKESAVVYAILSRPGILAGGESEHHIAEAKDFLNDLAPHLATYNTRLELASQDELIKKLEKKEAGLLSDSTDLAKKTKLLNDKILENSKFLELQRAELEKQRAALQAIKDRLHE